MYYVKGRIKNRPAPEIPESTYIIMLLETIASHLQELKEISWDTLDEGKEHYIEGIATTTHTAYKFEEAEPWHPVKGYILKNDGPDDLGYTHIAGDAGRMRTLGVGEDVSLKYSRRVVKYMFLKTTSGTANYRLWLLW